MAEFQVPQFIEEGEIVGPFTLMQFFISRGCGRYLLPVFMCLRFSCGYLSLLFWLVLIALAFVKINGQDFPPLKFCVSFIWKPRRYGMATRDGADHA